MEIDDQIIEVGGSDKRTTNNRMELSAVFETLNFLKNKVDSRRKLQIFTDSSYVANGVSTWIHGWKRNDWKNKAGDEIANVDLWQRISELLDIYEIQMVNIEGHAGIPGNDRADEIATAFADGNPANLYQGSKTSYQINLDTTKVDTKKLADKKRSSGKAYSYLSLVGGELKVHQTWAECEARVKGQSGAKFKKALDKDDEGRLIKDWS